MNKHFISDELYNELLSLPDNILTDTATMLTNQWLDNPFNGNALMGMLIAAEAIFERGLEFPEPSFNEKTCKALEILKEICESNGIFFSDDAGYSS